MGYRLRNNVKRFSKAGNSKDSVSKTTISDTFMWLVVYTLSYKLSSFKIGFIWFKYSLYLRVICFKDLKRN